MKRILKKGLFASALFVALQTAVNAQSIPPNQARADADLNRQRAESLAVQRKNEQTEKEDRAQFEARKKAYEKEERRKEEQQKRDAQVREKALQKAERSENRK